MKALLGPTPQPDIPSLRDWDFRLLSRYQPTYDESPTSCSLCALGMCDLAPGRKGACGITLRAHRARLTLLTAVTGAAAHTSSARAVLRSITERLGRDQALHLGPDLELAAPLVSTIVGIHPRSTADLLQALEYVEGQIVELLSATSVGQEASPIDLESKAFHAGMVDLVALEVWDLAQIVAYGFPKGETETPYVAVGLDVVKGTNPTLLIIGHDARVGIEIMEYLQKNGLSQTIDVVGLCCSGHEISRKSSVVKIIGPMSSQLRFVRSGVMDVIVTDQQCIRADLLEEAARVGSALIATSPQLCFGLPDKTGERTDSIVGDLAEGRIKGALILDEAKAAEVAVRLAMEKKPLGQAFGAEISLASRAELCLKCRHLPCDQACPNHLKIYRAITMGRRGNPQGLAALSELCLGCSLCDDSCPAGIPILALITEAAREEGGPQKYPLRVGRGPIRDSEVREVGPPIVMGKIPGIICFAGCDSYSGSFREVCHMAEELIKRNYIVLAAGCAALTLAMDKDVEGRTLYERYPGTFDEGGLINLGPCVSVAHAAGAAIKIANILTARSLLGNFEEVADYILNRVGACVLIWGPMAQKVLAAVAGLNRLGIPVIMGPRGERYGRLLLGSPQGEWKVYDRRVGDEVVTGPVPEHLHCVATSPEEALAQAAKLCMRPNDTTGGRRIKLSHYIELYQSYRGCLPPDLPSLIRNEEDIPLHWKPQVLAMLRGWKPSPIPDPTLLPKLLRRVKSR